MWTQHRDSHRVCARVPVPIRRGRRAPGGRLSRSPNSWERTGAGGAAERNKLAPRAFPRSLRGTLPTAVPGAESGPRGGRRRSGRDLAPSSAASGAPGPAAREPPPEVGSGLGPAPLRPRRPPETAATPARDSHVRVPPEGVGDVLHHPLHQHRHLLARLGHVGGRAARARLRDSAARPAGFRGERACAPVWRSSRLRPCRRRGRRELPGRPPVAGAWRPPGPERPGGSGPDVLSWSLTVGQRPGRCCRLSGRSRSYTFHSHFYPVGAAE